MSLEHAVLYSDLSSEFGVPSKEFTELDIDTTVNAIAELIHEKTGRSHDEVLAAVQRIVNDRLMFEVSVCPSSRLMSDVGFDGL